MKNLQIYMKTSRLLFPIVLIVGLSACSLFSPEETPTTSPPPTDTPLPNPANADVVFVRAVENEDRTWTFHVTVEHPDTGWEDYADGWDIVMPDNTVILPDPGSPFTRLLTHPHETEQPFTRSQSGIIIPSGTKFVTVRAHDLVDGFGGQEVTVYLDQSNGLNFEVERVNQTSSVSILGLTNQRPDGNRYQTGQINLLESQPIDIPLAGVPIWVVGVPAESGSTVWIAALEDGRLQGFKINQQEIQKLDIPALKRPPGAPPASQWNGQLDLLNDHAPNLAEFSHPIRTTAGDLTYINTQGDLIFQGDENLSINLDALPDGRVLSDGTGNLLLLTSPTGVYNHAVLGDAEEAKSATLINEKGEIIQRIALFSDQVIEGIAPIWVDLDDDGTREIILTLSDRRNGAQIVVYSQTGQLIAQGQPIGAGYRWRHQIAVAPFGPNREIELVDVLTPHIGGTVEFFQLDGSKLVKVAEVPGYTSHVINSRNLDMALAGDMNADGQVELLLPVQSLDQLGIIQRNQTGAEVVGEIDLDARLSSNLAAISLPNGGLAIAAGLDNSILRVWLP